MCILFPYAFSSNFVLHTYKYITYVYIYLRLLCLVMVIVQGDEYELMGSGLHCCEVHIGFQEKCSRKSNDRCSLFWVVSRTKFIRMMMVCNITISKCFCMHATLSVDHITYINIIYLGLYECIIFSALIIW